MRKLVIFSLILLVAVVSLRPRRGDSVGPTTVFPLSLNGKVYQTDIAFGPGYKVVAAKVSDKVVGELLLGVNTEDFSVPFLDVLNADPAGRFFVYFDGRNADGTTSFRFATNPNGVLATTLPGVITQDGFFWAAGSYTLPMVGTLATIFANGKASFAKGTFTPTKIKGTVNILISNPGQGFTVKFKTGKPLA